MARDSSCARIMRSLQERLELGVRHSICDQVRGKRTDPSMRQAGQSSIISKTTAQ